MGATRCWVTTASNSTRRLPPFGWPSQDCCTDLSGPHAHMSRWAIGDVQGCYTELDELLQRIRFNADRDLLLFTGDLVNRGPQSLATLRRIRNLAANAIVVLGNHDLHLLAVAFVPDHRLRRSDTLDEVLDASDRDA